MKPVSRGITLGMSPSIVLCAGIIVPASGAGKNWNLDGTTTIADFGVPSPGIIQQPQNGTPTTTPRGATATTLTVNMRINSQETANNVNQDPTEPAKPQPFKTLSEGEEVEFEIINGPKGGN